jgi:DNA replication protein DnaC
MFTSEGLTAYRYWRAEVGTPTEEDVERDRNGTCSICGGWGYVNVDGNAVKCLCATVLWASQIAEKIDPYRSPVRTASWEDIKPRDSRMETLLVATQGMKEFIGGLDRWVILMGSFGVGKTLLMRVANTELDPIALYITCGDLERQVHQAVGNHTLSQLITTLAQAPVLLLDDYGMEYGSDIFNSTVASIVSMRDAMWKIAPTVVATNLARAALYGIPRVGSRLLDEEKSYQYVISVGDYRLVVRRKG